ncbi:CD209 antigen-like protein B [Palaemon carinicauda]|uniref:CD209 antigen-like protein B n=1 Tax=Palaemon carinicauda TaxID=392227 RepID=UPI0035B6A8F5
MAKLLLFVEVFLATVLSLSAADDHTEIVDVTPFENDKVKMLREMLLKFRNAEENNRRMRRSKGDGGFFGYIPFYFNNFKANQTIEQKTEDRVEGIGQSRVQLEAEQEKETDQKTEQETVTGGDTMADIAGGLCENLSQKWDSSLQSLVSVMEKTISRLKDQEDKFVKVMDKLSSTDAIINETFSKLIEIEMNRNVDRCKPGWHHFEDSCYFFSFNEFDWLGGRQECQKMDSDYAKVTSTTEWNFIASQISGNSWIGLTDADEEGTLKWITDGTVYSDKQDSWWHNGQPDNHLDHEDCVHYWLMYDKLLWNDAKCEAKLRYICEMEAQTLTV